MHTGPRSLRLTFLPDSPAPPADETLLRVAYGAAQQRATEAGLELALPPLGGGPFAEVWSSDRIAGRGASGAFRWVRFGGRLFAWAVFDEDDGLEAASRRACAELLALACAQGCPRLVRVWNHLPALDRDGRYQAFCAGRRRAMTADAAALAAPLPAATAAGSGAPGLAVLALTAARAPRALDNPRQTPPPDYPAALGPRGPSFSRGAWHADGGAGALFLSGTASIVGHATRHPGDAAAQAREALRNHAAVVEQARLAGLAGPERAQDLPFQKVYLADPADLPAARAALDRALGAAAPRRFVQSALCRADLRLELESAALDGGG